MERYLIDINILPKAKREVIKEIISTLATVEKSAFIRGLIFLGFVTSKQSDFDFANSNIRSSNANTDLKIRVTLTGTSVANFVSKFELKQERRSCLHSFLYSGINRFIEYQEKLKGKLSLTIIDEIEKNLFLSGLGDYVEIGQIYSFEIKMVNSDKKIDTRVTPPKNVALEKETIGINQNNTNSSPQGDESELTSAIERKKEEQNGNTGAFSLLQSLNIDAG